MSQLLVVGVSAAITLFIQLTGFAAAFALQTEVFYDVLGGVNYMALAAYSAWSASTPQHQWSEDFRKVTTTVLFAVSRGWLLLFLAWRAHERGGDSRFDGVKDKFFKFMTFWLVQGMWVLLISMPVLFINASSAVIEMTIFDWLVLIGFAYGVIVEVVADVQKALWVKSGRPGGFCQVGLWSLSRHPNYFGEIFQWWCAWALAYSSASSAADKLWWACIVSPLFTMHILLNIKETGICNAEGKNLKRYYDKQPEEYRSYRQGTSILIPMIGYKFVPMFIKRVFLFEFAKYEYRPKKGNSDQNVRDKKAD